MGKECRDGVEMHGALFPEFDGGAVPETEEKEVECEGKRMDGNGDADGKNSGNREFFGEAGVSGMDSDEIEGESGDDREG